MKKKNSVYLALGVVSILTLGLSHQSVNADNVSTTTKGSVTFIVNPSNPDQPVNPKPNGDGLETVTEVGNVQNDEQTSSEDLIKPSDDMVLQEDTQSSQTVVNEQQTPATQKEPKTLPNTGVSETNGTYMTVLGLVLLMSVGYGAWRSFAKGRN